MNMPAIAQENAANSVSASSLILQGESFNRIMDVAKVMASGVASIPEHLRGNVGDCFAIAMQAMQWNMNPWPVAQKTHQVKGILGYEAQLVNAVIISIAPITGRPNYEWFGDWSKVTGKFKILTGDKGEYRVPGWKLADEEGLGVKVWATIKGESEPRVLTLLLAQARTRNSTLWADDPQQQLAYLGLKKWSRLHTPDVIMGVYTKDELEEVRPEIDITPRADAPLVPEEKPVLPAYPDAAFNKNFDTWKTAIEKGDQTKENWIATLQKKGTITDEQMSRINSVNNVIQGEVEHV